MVFEIVWEYEVRPEKVAAFEVLYGPEGYWARLFRRAAGPTYAALDRRGEALTVRERRLGAFDG